MKEGNKPVPKGADQYRAAADAIRARHDAANEAIAQEEGVGGSMQRAKRALNGPDNRTIEQRREALEADLERASRILPRFGRKRDK